MRPLLGLILGALLIFAASCNLSRNISGTYRSNFAVGGFFVTRIVLNKDSTFTYRMSGDLVYDTAFGSFQVSDKEVLLTYGQLIGDTSYEYGTDVIPIHEYYTKSHNLHRAQAYKIGVNRLLLMGPNLGIIKRQWGYSRNRKALLFGSRWRMKRYFLKKVR
jgi:hypothetical protein